MENCPLCHSENTSLYYEGDSRKYYLCSVCGLVFVPDVYLLPPNVEKKKYDKHKNLPDDLIYQEYLKQIMNPVLGRIEEGAVGLDFGSGPGPTLSRMFESRGFKTDIYDAYYAPNDHLFKKTYDFITVCEVVEHFYKPQMELDRLFDMLKFNGILAIKTQMLPFEEEFPAWYYKRDMTHVCFFSERSMRFLAHRWKAKLILIKSDVVLFIKTSNGV